MTPSLKASWQLWQVAWCARPGTRRSHHHLGPHAYGALRTTRKTTCRAKRWTTMSGSFSSQLKCDRCFRAAVLPGPSLCGLFYSELLRARISIVSDEDETYAQLKRHWGLTC
jgi:hypothetical protein